jgi:hypothetical protein
VVIEVPNFDHLARETRRALAGTADDIGEVRFAELEDAVHGHDSPGLARVEGDTVILQLPPISAFREDGAELRLERSWVCPPEDGRLRQEWAFNAPEGGALGSFSAVDLTRARLEPLLPGPARWLGNYDGQEWSDRAPFSIAVLES